MRVILLFTIATFCISLQAQQTMGLFSCTPEAEESYALYGVQQGNTIHLMNNCGEQVHSWTSNYGSAAQYLLEDGNLLRIARGSNSEIEILDWNSNVIWSYSVAAYGRLHHDIEPLPNGNILLIVKDQRPVAELIQNGGFSTFDTVTSEQIIEIQPDLVNGGATTVWEWKVWDHLVQDVDNTKLNFGNVGQSPEKVDINTWGSTDDWLHMNGVGYNAQLDQIIMSVRSLNELWIIDHSTSTVEASGSTGGIYGKGGDLLYRWGNPQVYDQGTASDRKLFAQHNTHWITDGFVDGGKIILFNNRTGDTLGLDYSTIDIVAPPMDSLGFYTYNGGAYGPTEFDWTYQAPVPTDFFSRVISGVQRLANGNTLICEGVGGRFLEVNQEKEIVWEYVNPVNAAGIMTQGDALVGNNVFRCTKYPYDYPAFIGKDLTPQGFIEEGSTFVCNPQSSIGNCDEQSIFANDSTNAVCFETTNFQRICYANNIPNHQYLVVNNGDTIKAQDNSYFMCLAPELSSEITSLAPDTSAQQCTGGIMFGISTQGVRYAPYNPMYWENPITQEPNFNWSLEASQAFTIDGNGGYINSELAYHYRKPPIDYFVKNLHIDSSKHSPIVGFAADGFPIYYKYLYTLAEDTSSGIDSFASAYSLKSGVRPGDSITAPGGLYDGTYVEDYEYISQQTALDECGGRFGVTPEYPNGTYYYVLTDNWPYIPRCLKGAFIDESFKIGPNCEPSITDQACGADSINTALKELFEEQHGYVVYPNPTFRDLHIEFEKESIHDEVTSIKIYNELSSLIYKTEGFSETIDVREFSTGVYFIQVEFGQNQITKKFVVQD